MNQIRPTSGAAHVLAGSLAAFPLLDVLRLLGRTRHSGQLQVVGDGVEAHLWIDGGELCDNAAVAADRLFELACLDEAWFTVTAAAPSAAAERSGDRIPLDPLLDQVGPQVAEWQALIRALPFDAVARMAPAMSGAEVHIRADQWRVLSLVGAGRPVHEVVDVADGRPLDTLRIVYELAEQQLISVEPPAAAGKHRRTRTRAAPPLGGELEQPPAANGDQTELVRPPADDRTNGDADAEQPKPAPTVNNGDRTEPAAAAANGDHAELVSSGARSKTSPALWRSAPVDVTVSVPSKRPAAAAFMPPPLPPA